MKPSAKFVQSRGSSICETLYRGGKKGLYVLLSRTQAGPGRAIKEEQEENSRNHIQTLFLISVEIILLQRVFDLNLCCEEE